MNSTEYKDGINSIFNLSEKVIKKWMTYYSNKSNDQLFNDNNSNFLLTKPIILKHENICTAFYLDIVPYNYSIDIDNIKYKDVLLSFEVSIRIVYNSILKTMDKSLLSLFKNIYFKTDDKNHIFKPYIFHNLETEQLLLTKKIKMLPNSDISKNLIPILQNTYNNDIIKINHKLNSNEIQNEILNLNKHLKYTNCIGIKSYNFTVNSSKDNLDYFSKLQNLQNIINNEKMTIDTSNNNLSHAYHFIDFIENDSEFNYSDTDND